MQRNRMGYVRHSVSSYLRANDPTSGNECLTYLIGRESTGTATVQCRTRHEKKYHTTNQPKDEI